MTGRYSRGIPAGDSAGASGFSLAEFLVSTFIMLLVASAVFAMLAETQRAASYQTEVQAVLDNARIATDTVERILRQAGNDPLAVGFPGLTIVSGTEVRVRSDLTGSAAGAGEPDKGDSDGDTADAGEDVTIRYNAANRSLEVTPNGGSAQAVANYITAFNMQYIDANGGATGLGANVRKVRVALSAATTLADPQTKRTFGLQQASDVQIATRQ